MTTELIIQLFALIDHWNTLVDEATQKIKMTVNQYRVALRGHDVRHGNYRRLLM